MRLAAILKQRCPHCLQGEVFGGVWKMHETCPICGIKYEREDGYFMMSVFIGYVLCLVAFLPVGIVLYLNDAPLAWYLVASVVTLVGLSPLIFRYARVMWMHIDELLDPRQVEG